MRESAAQHRADLRDLPRCAEPVEPRGERLLQGRRDRLRAALHAALQEQARHLLDEQRHAAGALVHPLDDVLGQRMTRREFADHARDLRAIERRERDHAMVRAHAPTRAELRPRRRDDEERRLGAALGQRPHEIERSRIGPVQVLEGEHDRLRSARPPEPRPSSPPVAGAATPPARISHGDPPAAGRRPAARAGAHIRPRPGRSAANVFSRSARRCSAGTSAPNRCRPHSAIGCSGVFCNSCDDDHSTQVCGVSPSRVAKLLDQPRLADAGLADDQRELAFAFERARPAARQQRKFVLAADERRQARAAAAPAAAARPHDAIERHRRRHALEVMRALVLGDEQACDLPLHGRRDDDRARLRGGLHARGDIGRLAEHFAGRVDHDRSGLDADAGGKLGRAGRAFRR